MKFPSVLARTRNAFIGKPATLQPLLSLSVRVCVVLWVCVAKNPAICMPLKLCKVILSRPLAKSAPIFAIVNVISGFNCELYLCYDQPLANQHSPPWPYLWSDTSSSLFGSPLLPEQIFGHLKRRALGCKKSPN